jgi:hypothetical protein
VPALEWDDPAAEIVLAVTRPIGLPSSIPRLVPGTTQKGGTWSEQIQWGEATSYGLILGERWFQSAISRAFMNWDLAWREVHISCLGFQPAPIQ